MTSEAAKTAVEIVIEELAKNGFLTLSIGSATREIIAYRVENVHAPCGRELKETNEVCYCDRDD